MSTSSKTKVKKKSKPVELRVCASCEWIFRYKDHGYECPKCQFASYSAYSVYQRNAYRYETSQAPWKKKRLDAYSAELDSEIKLAWPKKTQDIARSFPVFSF